MAEYLIQDTTLDAIADAINAKTGGSAAMTPAEMVTEIAAIPSGGGTADYVEGTFTLASDGEFPTITHNFGTKKIAGFVIPHYGIAAHAGYRNYLSFFVNWTAFIDDEETWTKDFTPYNSTRFPNVLTVTNETIKSLMRDHGFASPWTSQSDQWIGNYGRGLAVTDTTVKTGTNAIWCSGTYYYRIFKLG